MRQAAINEELSAQHPLDGTEIDVVDQKRIVNATIASPTHRPPSAVDAGAHLITTDSRASFVESRAAATRFRKSPADRLLVLVGTRRGER